MVNTTIALRREVYKILLDTKCNMTKRQERNLSFSDVIVLLCENYNKKNKDDGK